MPRAPAYACGDQWGRGVFHFLVYVSAGGYCFLELQSGICFVKLMARPGSPKPWLCWHRPKEGVENS